MRIRVPAFVPSASAVAAFVAVLVLAVPHDAHAQAKTLKQTFQAMNQKLHEALVNGDAAAAAACYAKQAKLYPPNAEAVNGQAEIQKFWQGAIDQGVRGLRITTVEAEGRVDSGFEVSTFEVLDAKGAVIDRGKAIVVWKVESGTWRLWRDIWNSSLPAAAPSVAPTPLETK